MEKKKIYPQHELGRDPLHPMPDVECELGDELSKEEVENIRQNSYYAGKDRPRPDNNLFFERRSNPLSSKGD